MEAEWGSVEGVRFTQPESSGMYDSDGNLMLCKCGKRAGGIILGVEAFKVFCPGCSPLNEDAVQFVYKQPPE